MAGYLIAQEGTLKGLVISFDKGSEWILGRDPDECTHVLADPSVSRKHLICIQTEEGFSLENLSSINPVTLDDQILVAPTLLKEGSIVHIGNTSFLFTTKPPDQEKEPGESPPTEEEVEEDLTSIHFDLPHPNKWLLKVISGPNAGAEFSLEPSTSYILGRDTNLSDVVFHDLSVSRQHAKITLDAEGNLFVEDMETRNGVIVNGELIREQKKLSSQDLVALGTTSFLVIDRDQIHETIISPPSGPIFKPEEISHAPHTPTEAKEPKTSQEKAAWKEMVIPTKHLILAGFFCLFLLLGVFATFSLFRSEPVVISTKHEHEKIKEALKPFSSVQFSFNEASGKLFLLGHILTIIDKQELSYNLSTLPFITSIEDTLVIDELVWQNMNALLLFNPDWQTVTIQALSPGHFVLKGFVQTLDQAQGLSEYINTNFPYPNLLDNQITVGDNLILQIQSLLIESGFDGVLFNLTNQELILTGRIDDQNTKEFSSLLKRFQSFPGIRMVKNFVIASSADTSRIDLSSQYVVTGFSLSDNNQQFVVINQKIFSIGDFLSGMLITDIQSNLILLEKDGLKFRINYNLQ